MLKKMLNQLLAKIKQMAKVLRICGNDEAEWRSNDCSCGSSNQPGKVITFKNG